MLHNHLTIYLYFKCNNILNAYCKTFRLELQNFVNSFITKSECNSQENEAVVST